MWRGFVVFALLVAAQITASAAQNSSDVAAPRCKDVRKLLSSMDSITLDIETLAAIDGGLQRVLDCVPERAAVQFNLSELELDDTLKIDRPVSIEGSAASVPCLDDNTQPTIDIRSNDVLVAGFSFVGCNLNSTSGLIQVKGAENVTLTDIVFQSNVNTKGPSCASVIDSTIEIQNTAAKNNVGLYGGVLSIAEGSGIAVMNSSFENNHATQRGGAIHIHNSDLNLSSCRFFENLAVDGGGAMFAVGEKVSKLRMKNVEYVGNRAYGNYKDGLNWRVGGGIAVLGPKVKAEISEVTFMNNSATDLGGAISAYNGTKLSIQNSAFIENHAIQGGAIYVESSLPNVTNLVVDGSYFTRNYANDSFEVVSSMGGAIAMLFNGTDATLKDSSFIENKAGLSGGAVAGAQSRKMNIVGSKFLGNRVLSNTSKSAPVESGKKLLLKTGGAVTLVNVPLFSIVESNFIQNVAVRGGALFVDSVDVKNPLLRIIGSTFEGNSAAGNSSHSDGGAFALFGEELKCYIEKSMFRKNGADISGGAIYTVGISRFKVSSSYFIENICEVPSPVPKDIHDLFAREGGAIRLNNVSESIILESTFVRNGAVSGGGIAALDTNLLIKESSFEDNVVTLFGGGISLQVTNTTIFNSNFTRNTAIVGGGGAIDSTIGSRRKSSVGEERLFLITKSVAFKDNFADDRGGSVQLFGVDLAMEDSLFRNNSAKKSGGAINIIQREAFAPIATIKTTSFIGNGADLGGGIYVQNADLSLSDCAFESNLARIGGGALFCEDLSSNLIFANKDSIITVEFSNFTEDEAGKHSKGNRAAGVESVTSKGGAVAISGLGLISAFKNCKFSKNVAGSGGAIYVQDVQKMTLEDSTFRMGKALAGGALAIINTGIVVNNVKFIGNSARSGGAVSFTQVGSIIFLSEPELRASIKLAHFVDNAAMEGGGAIDLREMSFECESCLFDSNSAGFGGNGIGSGGAIRALPASNLTLINSSIINCMATWSGGGVSLEDAIFHGENLTIKNNTAIENGGGLAMHLSAQTSNQLAPWRCKSCSIQGNQAKKGGGLHVSAEEATQPNCQALGPTLFVENKLADCEGSLEIPTLPEPEVHLHNAVFGGNNAEDSGSDVFLSNFKNNVCCDDQCWSVASAPDEGVEKCGLGETLQRDGRSLGPLGTIFESVSISPSGVPNHASGEELPAIKVTPLDSFGQIAMDNMTLRIEVATPGGGLFGSPVTSEGVLMRGTTTVTGVFMRALPDYYNLSFKLTSEDGKRIVAELLTVEIRECVIGEVSREEGLRCDRCDDNFFSFNTTDETCTQCPEGKAKCSGGTLVPLEGFWHSDFRSAHVHACLTEEACTYPNRTNALFAFNLNFSGEYPQCAQGYSDMLCGSCDTSHGRSRFKCTECQGGVPAGLGLGGVMLVLAVLSLIYVKSAAKYSQGVLGEQSDVVSASSAVPSGSHGGFDLPAFILGEIPNQEVQRPHQNAPPRKSSDIFKILVNFFQVTGSAAAINVDWTRSMLMLFAFWDSISGVADSNSFFSFECAFSPGETNLPRSIQTSAVLAIVPFMVWATLAVVHYAHALRSKKSFQEIKLWSYVALLAVQQASYISVTRTLVRIFYCVDVSPVEGLFWVQDTSVRCYKGSHAYLVGFVGAPGLLLISIGFPGWLLFKLTRSAEVLEKEEVVRQYGSLYKAYKKNVAAWEVVILLRKALLAAVVVFGRTLGKGVQTNLALFIMMGSIMLQMYFQPFLESKLNFLELGSLAISTLAFMIGNLVDQPEMTHGGRVATAVIFIGITGIYIAYSLKQIFDVAFVELREWMENGNSGSPLPTSNFKLMMTAIKTQVKKIKIALNKKRAACVRSFPSCLSCEMTKH